MAPLTPQNVISIVMSSLRCHLQENSGVVNIFQNSVVNRRNPGRINIHLFLEMLHQRMILRCIPRRTDFPVVGIEIRQGHNDNEGIFPFPLFCWS